MPALGERFRAVREARGLTLSEVAEQIRIRSVYLGAIEEENWSLIGAPVYTRGFLRTYARFLGIDPEEAVAAFNSQTAVPSEAPGEEAATRPRAGSKELKPFIWIASAIAVALVAFVVYNEIALQQRQPAAVAIARATPALKPSMAPSAQTGGTPLPLTSPSPGSQTTPGPSTIAVHLVALSWLRITVDGNVTIEGTFPAGTERTFRGKYASVRVGNAGGVQILVDGKSIGLLGKTGVVADRTFTL
jgi:cytoskeleton protein RodZ